MKRINWFCANAINVVFSVFFLLMCGYCLIPEYGFTFVPYKVILFAIVLAGLFFFLTRKLQATEFRTTLYRHRKKVVAATIGILFLFQLFVFKNAATQIGFDCAWVVHFAESPLSSIAEDYMLKYPNNLMLVLIFKVWGKLTNGWLFDEFWKSSIVLNIIFVDITIWIICGIVQKISPGKGMYTALFLAVLSLGLSPYILVSYSDTMVMPFLAGFLYAVIAVRKSVGKKKSFLYACLASFLIIMGYMVKPTTAIAAIAVVGIAVVSGKAFEKITWKRAVAYLLCFVSGIVMIVGVNQIKYSVAPKEVWENSAFPMSHFMMMGLGAGGYSKEDVLFTASYPTKEEKRQATLQEIQNRLKTRWNDGTLGKHLWFKSVYSFSDGTFYYGREGYFHHGEEKASDGIRGMLQNFTYIESTFYQQWYSSYLQALWFLMCLLMASYLIQSPKHKTLNEISILQLSVLGLWIFLMLFECRGRYVFHFLPIFIILVAFRIVQIKELCSRRLKK